MIMFKCVNLLIKFLFHLTRKLFFFSWAACENCVGSFYASMTPTETIPSLGSLTKYSVAPGKMFSTAFLESL